MHVRTLPGRRGQLGRGHFDMHAYLWYWNQANTKYLHAYIYPYTHTHTALHTCPLLERPGHWLNDYRDECTHTSIIVCLWCAWQSCPSGAVWGTENQRHTWWTRRGRTYSSPHPVRVCVSVCAWIWVWVCVHVRVHWAEQSPRMSHTQVNANTARSGAEGTHSSQKCMTFRMCVHINTFIHTWCMHVRHRTGIH